MPDTEPIKALSTELNRLSEIAARDFCRRSVNLPEEPDVGKPQVRFCEGSTTTDVWLRWCGTAGKPGGKRRTQTSTYSVGRN